MTILITGGTGFVGSHLGRALLRQGHTVRLLGRNFSRVTNLLTGGAVAVPADLREWGEVVAACRGAELVYHVGAYSAPWGRWRDFHAINVGGTAAVIAGCLQQGVRRLVYVSSPSVVFNGQDQHHLTEAAAYPHRFASRYSASKKLGEDRVRHVAHQLETVIIRPKAVFGSGDTTLLPRLIATARAGRLPQIGNGRNLVDLTYIDNVVHALQLAGTAPAAVGNTYHITNNEHIAVWDMVREVLGRLGIPANLRRVSVRGALLYATLLEARAALTGNEPHLTRYSVAILARTQTYNIAAAMRDLGYAPQVTVQQGIERTLASLPSPPGTHHANTRYN